MREESTTLILVLDMLCSYLLVTFMLTNEQKQPE